MTMYTFVRGAKYSDSEMLDNIEESLLRYIFKLKIDKLIEQYDPTLIWFPHNSEIYGIVGETEADPGEFSEWWDNHGDNTWEEAWEEAVNEFDLLNP